MFMPCSDALADRSREWFGTKPTVVDYLRYHHFYFFPKINFDNSGDTLTTDINNIVATNIIKATNT